MKYMRRFWQEVIQSVRFLKRLLRQYRWIFIGVVFLFLFSILLGVLVPYDLKEMLFKMIKDKFTEWNIEDSNLFTLILFNNIRALVIVVLSGIIFVLPLIILFFNGYLIGVVMSYLSVSPAVNALSPLSLFLSLIPHGIFELPAIILAAFLGVLLGIKLLDSQTIVKEQSRIQFVVGILKILLFVLIPVIFVAAAIESTLSLFIVQQFTPII